MKKRIFSLFFAVVFLMTAVTCIVPAAAEEASLRPSVSAIDGAEMILAVGDTVLTGDLRSADLPAGDPSDDVLWKVSVKSKGYVFQSLSSKKYLNVTKDGVTLEGKAQTLKLTQTIGGSLISAGNFYLALDLSGWKAVTGKESASTVTFYTQDIREYDNAGQDPLFTLACFSDLHISYGIQNEEIPIRPSTQVAADALKQLGGADAIIVGGDVIGGGGAWGQDLFKKVKSTIYNTLADATGSKNVFLITGNHDIEPGLGNGDKYHSGNYDDIMLDNAGAFTASFYSTELENPVDSTRFNELLCYRYTVNNMEIIGLNTPYRSQKSDGYLYAEQLDWLTGQMKEIGRDKTVVLFCHYPVDGVASPAEDKGGNAASKLKTLLGLYPNIIYCYGHIHDGNDMTWYNSIERAVPSGNAVQLDNGAYDAKGYITCHMGSMGYYKTHYQPDWLSAEDPVVVQFLMIDFYADHITFKYHNSGEKSPDPDVYEITSFTVMRDMWQLTGGTPSGDSDAGDKDASDSTDASATDAPTLSGSGNPAPAEGPSGMLIALIVVGVAVVAGVAAVIPVLLKRNRRS